MAVVEGLLTIKTVKTLWDMGVSLLDLSAKFREADAKRRDEVSRYFAEIADCLERTAASLSQGKYPHGECASLEMHADTLQQTIGDYIGKSKAKRFEKQLKAVHSVEMMFPEIQNDSHLRDTELPKLTATAGVFRALSQIVAASTPSFASRSRPSSASRSRALGH
jgi:hypothetical protein